MRTAWCNLKQMSVCGRDRLQLHAITIATFGSASRCKIGNPRRLTILLWVYVAQALAGSVIGFAAPFLYYFGVL